MLRCLPPRIQEAAPKKCADGGRDFKPQTLSEAWRWEDGWEEKTNKRDRESTIRFQKHQPPTQNDEKGVVDDFSGTIPIRLVAFLVSNILPLFPPLSEPRRGIISTLSLPTRPFLKVRVCPDLSELVALLAERILGPGFVSPDRFSDGSADGDTRWEVSAHKRLEDSSQNLLDAGRLLNRIFALRYRASLGYVGGTRRCHRGGPGADTKAWRENHKSQSRRPRLELPVRGGSVIFGAQGRPTQACPAKKTARTRKKHCSRSVCVFSGRCHRDPGASRRAKTKAMEGSTQGRIFKNFEIARQ